MGVVPLPTPLSGQSAVYLTLGEVTWIKRCRSVIYSHDWTVSGIFEPGRSDKRLVFVFLCRALIMDIFRKYNMRV